STFVLLYKRIQLSVNRSHFCSLFFGGHCGRSSISSVLWWPPLLEYFAVAVWKAKTPESQRVKDWEIIADNLHDAGWGLGWVSALDREGRTISIVDAYGYGKTFHRARR